MNKLIVKVALMGMLLGAVVGIIRYYKVDMHDHLWAFILKGMMIGGIVSFTISWLDQGYFQQNLRRFNFLATLLIKTFVYTLIIIAVFFLATWLFLRYLPVDIQLEMFIPTLLITFSIILVSLFLVSINRLLGGRVLFNFFTGKYHQPREENRIFLFADIISSTSVAEKIGNKMFHLFLSDFIYDITGPVKRCKGEIYKYVGDEIIVTWLAKDNGAGFNAINCHFEMKKVLS